MKKRILALLLVCSLCFAFAGCKKAKSPEELEKEISAKLAAAQTMDVDMDAKITVPDSTQTQTVTINGNIKVDIRNDFPKFSMDATMGIENFMSLPMKMYMDEQNIGISAFGQTSKEAIPEEQKTKISQVIKEAKKLNENNNNNIKKSVSKTKVDDKDALEITVDSSTVNNLTNTPISGNLNPLNQNTQDATFDDMKIYYILEKEELKEIKIYFEQNQNGQKTTCDMRLKINSLGENIEIKPLF